jgi:hypothetical protein
VVLPHPTWLTPRVTPIPAVGSGLPVVLPQPEPFRPRTISATPVAPPLPPAPPVVEETVAPPPEPVRRIDRRHILTGSAVAALAFLLLALFAFARPTTKPVTVKTPYSENVAFGYHAATTPAAGPVYPGGSLSTGDPVFLRLVHRVQVTVGYRFQADAPHQLAGTMDVVLRLTSATGWSREIPLAPATPFDGDRADSVVTLDLRQIRALTRQVERLTGMPEGGTYTLAVVPRLHATGTLAGARLKSEYSPHTTFQLDGLALRPGGQPKDGDRKGSVSVVRRAPNDLSLRRQDLPVPTLRWIALGGLLLAAVAALITLLPRFRRPTDPSGRVQARYGHLIVPIAGLTPTRTPIDVTTMDALVALAERGERLILHHRAGDADTYLVDDGGTLFRHEIRHPAAAR